MRGPANRKCVFGVVQQQQEQQQQPARCRLILKIRNCARLILVT